MIKEFNKELKSAEDRLPEIFRTIVAGAHHGANLKPYFANSCTFESTVVTFSPDQIKTLFSVLEKHAANQALIRPIDKDPIYKVFSHIKTIKECAINKCRSYRKYERIE